MAKVSISELAVVVGKQRKLVSKDLEKFISAMFVVINEGLDADKQVKVKGLGTFKVTSVKPRESVNVNTGKRVIIEGHDKVSFTPDASMRDIVNKPFAQFETVVLQDDVDFSDVEHDSPKQENTCGGIEKNDTVEEVYEKAVAEKTECESYDGEPVEKKEDEAKEDAGQQPYEYRGKSCRCFILAMVTSVVCFVAGLVLGLFLSGKIFTEKTKAEVSVTSPPVTVNKEVVKKESRQTKESHKTVAVSKENELDFDKMNADPRVRLGAYRIVGVDTIITLRKGQTMKSYCSATLGSGMLCYFQVLNDTTELSEGAMLKVPKVKVK